MPTVLRWRGYRFYFFSHEPNEPPHVHIDKDGRSVKFWLAPVAVARNHRFSKRDLNRLHDKVAEEQAEFLRVWHENDPE